MEDPGGNHASLVVGALALVALFALGGLLIMKAWQRKSCSEPLNWMGPTPVAVQTR